VLKGLTQEHMNSGEHSLTIKCGHTLACHTATCLPVLYIHVIALVLNLDHVLLTAYFILNVLLIKFVFSFVAT